MAEGLPGKHKVLNSIPSTRKLKRKEKAWREVFTGQNGNVLMSRCERGEGQWDTRCVGVGRPVLVWSVETKLRYLTFLTNSVEQRNKAHSPTLIFPNLFPHLGVEVIYHTELL